MSSTLGLLPLLGLGRQVGDGMMEELGGWKLVVVQLQSQPEHSYQAGTVRRKKCPDLSYLSPHTLQTLSGPYNCLNQLEAREQKSLHNTVNQDPLPGANSTAEKGRNKSGKEELGETENNQPSTQIPYLLMTLSSKCKTTHVSPRAS